MNLIPVNSEALERVLVALYGTAGRDVVLQAYHVVDQAMADAHMQGFKEGYQSAEAAYDKNADAAYDHGFMEGHAAPCDCEVLNEDQLQFEWDSGYLEGVHDARVKPEEADRYVALLVSQDVQEEDLTDFLDNVSDDENDHWDAIHAPKVPYHWDPKVSNSF